MLANYLTTAFRHLCREREYAAINLFGLALGLALCLLVIQLAAYQLSVGDFHEKRDRVYRILMRGEGPFAFSGSSMPIALGPTLREQVPEVEETARFMPDHTPRMFRVGAEGGIYEEALWTESSVFEMFSLPLLRGDSKTALSRPYTMVLTEPLARRLFGQSDPIGQVIRYNEAFDCVVTGIVGKPPSTSLLQFSALISLATMQKELHPVLQAAFKTLPKGVRDLRSSDERRWSVQSYPTFVQLNSHADATVVAGRIPDIVPQTKGGFEITYSYALQPLKSIYFDKEFPNGLGPDGDPMHLALFATMAMVLLTIAGFNYVNLATARAEGRLNEMGIRKALGAHRAQLIHQLLSESVLLSVGATVLGVAMAEAVTLLLPAIGGFGIELSARWTISAGAGAALLAIAVGLAAGAYPAWVVACFQPSVLKRGARLGRARLRQGLVVAQFTVTATMMTMTLLIWHQIGFTQSLFRENSVLGLEPEQVVIIENPHDGGLTAGQARAFKAELLQDSRIAAVSLSTAVPGLGPSGASPPRTSRYSKEGAEGYSISRYEADGDFVGVMGLRMVQGRPLTDEPADANAVVINETAVRRLELEEPLGRQLRSSPGLVRPRVVGVIQDFHFRGPRERVGPLLISQIDNRVGGIIVRVHPGNLEEALEVIDDKWAAAGPYRPIQRHSLEEVASRLYSEELSLGRALTAFLFLAIAVAVVGLFGMAAHAAHERTREIGVRKVFGASAGGLTAMMLRDFARPVAIAFLLSIPVAWWLGNEWLHDFTYRVEMGVGLFLLSGALSFLVAGLTVGHQAMRAALTNPVETLRTE